MPSLFRCGRAAHQDTGTTGLWCGRGWAAGRGKAARGKAADVGSWARPSSSSAGCCHRHRHRRGRGARAWVQRWGQFGARAGAGGPDCADAGEQRRAAAAAGHAAVPRRPAQGTGARPRAGRARSSRGHRRGTGCSSVRPGAGGSTAVVRWTDQLPLLGPLRGGHACGHASLVSLADALRVGGVCVPRIGKRGRNTSGAGYSSSATSSTDGHVQMRWRSP